MPVEFASLSSFQIDSLQRRKTVFFFPVGPLESHGPHLPLGLDLIEASRFCWESANLLEREMPDWVGIVMPGAPLGIESNSGRLAVTVRAHVLRDWLVDACKSLMREGFVHFVCYSGHLGPRQLTAIEDAGRIIYKRGRLARVRGIFSSIPVVRPTLVSVSSSFVSAKEACRAPFWPDPKEHGGLRDTSIALVVQPDRVHPKFRKLPHLKKPDRKWLDLLQNSKNPMHLYWGNPAGASVEVGLEEISEKVKLTFPKMRAVWEGSTPHFVFKSWYSLFPPNKSFFKAWILAFCILVCFIGWIYLVYLSAYVGNS